MMFARIPSGERIRPMKGVDASCPLCGAEVVAKMGSIVMHHWAHKADTSCGGEPETEWHRAWKECAPDDCVEVAVESDGQRRRADVMIGDTVIEFQRRTLDYHTIKGRQEFWWGQGKAVLWVAHAIDPFALPDPRAGFLRSDRLVWKNRSRWHDACHDLLLDVGHPALVSFGVEGFPLRNATEWEGTYCDVLGWKRESFRAGLAQSRLQLSGIDPKEIYRSYKTQHHGRPVARRVYEKMPFGKYKGLHIADVPKEYKDWLLYEADEPIQGTMRHSLLTYY